MNELNVTTQPGKVVFNFEEVKEGILEIVSQYKDLVVTPENLQMVKSKAKELAGLRTKIDNYRKDVKKEMSKPIEEFESKCKELVAIVQDAEKPIKEGIEFFDNGRRQEKEDLAKQVIAEVIEKHKLRPKYAEQLTVLPKYTNLTALSSDVREDVEQRAFLLYSEQVAEDEKMEIILETIEHENKTLTTPMNISQFAPLLSTMTAKQVISEVRDRAETIRVVERRVQEETLKTQPAPVVIPKPSEDDKVFQYVITVSGTKAQLEALANFMKTNNMEYEAERKA